MKRSNITDAIWSEENIVIIMKKESSNLCLHQLPLFDCNINII